MSINDPISLQVFFWLSAIVLMTLLICLCVVGFHTATSWSERNRSLVDVQKEITKTAEAHARGAEANARQAEMLYQKALLDRVGDTPQFTLTIPQKELDNLAMAYVKKRIEAMKVTIES